MELKTREKVLGSQSCLTLCNPWTVARQAPLWDSPGKIAGGSSHFFLQGIFLTQGLNPDLPHCRQILYQKGLSKNFKVI